MKTADQKELRGAVLKHLSVRCGIKLKLKISESLEKSSTPAHSQGKVFRVPLQNLHMINIPEYGPVPCFLVDACQYLLNHAGSEGLFRKSGSVVRLKALRSRLDEGDDCLSAALPCDVACLVKQFFQELSQPIFPPALLRAFSRTQQLESEKQRLVAAQLVSCLLPEPNKSILHFFLVFLHRISLRSSENKMDGYNLSVVFTPSLFHLYGPEWHADGYRLYIDVICTFIENAQSFAVVPEIILQDPSVVDKHLDHEKTSSFRWKNNGRRSLNVSLLRKAQTPGSEEMLNDLDVFPKKKRTSLRRSLGMAPSVLFGNSREEKDSSPSALWNRRLSNSARRSCARVCKTVKRVVSETVCCCASSPGGDPPSRSPDAPCRIEPYQDTPVGICLKRCSHEQESNAKSRAIPNVLKTLFCSSVGNSPEDRRLLVQDDGSPLHHPSDAPDRSQDGAEQSPVNTDKTGILPVGCSHSECIDTWLSKAEPVDNCNNVQVPTESGSAKRNLTIPESTEQSTNQTKRCGAKLNGHESDTPRVTKGKVVDRIRNYSRLKPAVAKVRSPLKFNRTPVYQYVKRINSCLRTGHLIK